MTARSQYLQLYICYHAWDPGTSCTQNQTCCFKVEFLPLWLSFMNPTLHTSHRVSLPFLQLLSTKSLEQYPVKRADTQLGRVISEAFPCHGSFFTVNLFCARNENYLRLYALDRTPTRPRTISKFTGEHHISVSFAQQRHGVIETIKSKTHEKHASSHTAFSHGKREKEKVNFTRQML